MLAASDKRHCRGDCAPTASGVRMARAPRTRPAVKTAEPEPPQPRTVSYANTHQTANESAESRTRFFSHGIRSNDRGTAHAIRPRSHGFGWRAGHGEQRPVRTNDSQTCCLTRQATVSAVFARGCPRESAAGCTLDLEVPQNQNWNQVLYQHVSPHSAVACACACWANTVWVACGGSRETAPTSRSILRIPFRDIGLLHEIGIGSPSQAYPSRLQVVTRLNRSGFPGGSMPWARPDPATLAPARESRKTEFNRHNSGALIRRSLQFIIVRRPL